MRDSPPDVKLIAGDDEVSGLQGSYVWRGRAVDRLISVPAESVVVIPGELLEFRHQGAAADQALLSVYAREDISNPGLTPVWEGELDPTSLHWKVNLEPGNYVLALFQAWGERDSVVHYFNFKVHSSVA